MNKDRLLEIYKIEADKYSKTRDIHWRVNIAMWTVVIVAIYAKSQNGFYFTVPNYVQILICLFYLGIHVVFIFKIHGSINRSMARMHDMVTYIIDKKEEVEIKWIEIGKNAPKPNNYWEYLQVGITLFLIGIFYFTKYAKS